MPKFVVFELFVVVFAALKLNSIDIFSKCMIFTAAPM
jgi:hypothetical protein